MIKFIFLCAGFVILLGLLLGFSVIRMFKQILFGSGNNTRKEAPGNRKNQNNSSRQQQHTAPKKKKIIEKDEGEYVDFEEVK